MTKTYTSTIHFQAKANVIMIQGLGSRVWKECSKKQK